MLIKWEPEAGSESLRRLQGGGQNLPVSRLGRKVFAPLRGQFVPTVEIKETSEEVILRAEIPGVRKNDINIDVTKNEVTIRGKRRSEKRARDPTYYHRASLHGVFGRVIKLPVEVVPDRAVAKLKNGILTLILPKAEPPGNKGTMVHVQ